LLTDISENQDNTLCIVNFLPSVDDFWVLGNSIYKDYYVYHNPETAITKWVPTAQRFKQPLEEGDQPQADIDFGYNWDLVYIKLVIILAAAVGTGATAQFVFTTDFPGVNFLNSSSRTSSKKAAIAKKVEAMSTSKLEELLEAVKERKAAQTSYDTNCIQ